MVNGNLFYQRSTLVLRNSFTRVRAFQLVFDERGEPEYPEKNLSKQGENQQQTQPTYDTGSGNRTRATLVGGATPAPLLN